MRHSRGGEQLRPWLLRFGGPAVALACWEIIVRAGVVKSIFLPAPSTVALAYSNSFSAILTAAGVTLRDVAAGYLVGCVFGLSLGVLIGYYRSLHHALAPILLVISPIPIVTFLPLFIIWFGLNVIPIICCASIAAFFPALMSAISGVRNVDYALVEVARNFGASDRQILKHVMIPMALPQICNGMRLSIQLCFLVTPVAEMILGDIGLGGLIWRSADLFRTDMVLAGQFTLGLMGIALYTLFDALEARSIRRWRRPESEHVH